MNKKSFIITYSNQLNFNGRLLVFRKKCLFDLTDGTPQFIPVDYRNNGRCWMIKGKRLSPHQAKKITILKEIKIDVSNLQWYVQEQLNECFNLEKP